MSIVLIVLVAGTLAAAAIDVRIRRIPDALTATMALAAIGFHLAGGPLAVVLALTVMAITLALGAVAFSARWFGGGDVKLIVAACGLVSYPGCVPLFAFILIAGAVLALAQAAREGRIAALIRSASAIALTGSAPQSRTLLPYGVAIASGSTAYAVATLLPAVRLLQ
jgi:Flp pilus assembly protein protease CpaA